MAWPEHSDPQRRDRRAKAPYNFVPLPEKVVEVDGELPSQDWYAPDLYTGYFDCTLKTESPLFVRGPLTLDEFGRQETHAKEEKEKPYREQIKNKPDFFYIDPITQKPAIPGSSLRGMLRTLVEIVSYGKIEWVAPQPTITYRAVAAPKDDPLSSPYKAVMGKYGNSVRAGYLIRRGDDWFIQPAKRPADLGWPECSGYLKVKEKFISSKSIPGFTPFDDSSYKPQVHEVSFNIDIRQGKRGEYVALTEIGPRTAGYLYEGTLVCSGNMLETAGTLGQGLTSSPRRNHALVLAPNTNEKPLKISKQVVKDYLTALTPFQKEALDERMGCLQEERPVFYVERNGAVIAFGHTPNFRVPAFLHGESRAATPHDFVPQGLRETGAHDLSDALFGGLPSGARKEGYASRIFVTHAHLDPEDRNDWVLQPSITPQILSTPKPTTFQHYLVQDRDQGHDPDKKKLLAHYGTPTPGETVIRGHKLYWHKDGDLSEADFTDPGADPHSTQHTLMKPVDKGTRFHFRVYFENLRNYELGALLWVLTLPGPDGPYRHKLGMGKPLGLGSVHIEDVNLQLSDRRKRYSQLFGETGEDWHLPLIENPPSQSDLIRTFEEFVMEKLDKDMNQRLSDLPRIRSLLTMLKWPGPSRDETEYMELEEFKERKVLPSPEGVASPRRERPRPSSPSVSQASGVQSQPAATSPPPMTMEQFRDVLKRGERAEQKLIRVGDKVKAEVIARDGDRITVRIIGAQSEEVTFTKPYYPNRVGQKVKLKVQKLDDKGRIIAVTP
jgi:CRISPR-associated protein (TIGR03986 family)